MKWNLTYFYGQFTIKRSLLLLDKAHCVQIMCRLGGVRFRKLKTAGLPREGLCSVLGQPEIIDHFGCGNAFLRKD